MKKLFLFILAFASVPAFSQITSWNYFPPPGSAYDSTIPQMTIGGNVVATAGSNLLQATQTLNYSPGLLTSITGGKGGYTKFTKASSVDNVELSALLLVCLTNPTFALLECGTSTTCASPTTIASGTVSSAGGVVDATVTNPAIAAGDYVAWSLTGGVCTTVDIGGSAQVHSI
jgi:hypothetical protein